MKRRTDVAKKKKTNKEPVLTEERAEKLNAILEGIIDFNDELLEHASLSDEFKNASFRLQETEMWLQRGFEAFGYMPEEDEDDEDEEDEEEDEAEEEVVAPKDSE
jgi:hypothetical protein